MLGINTIRIYNLDPSLDHNLCASIFNAVGIYMLLDVNSPLPGESLNPENLEDSYNLEYLKRIFALVEAFHHFPNTLGFFGGNEVINKISDGKTVPPYIRAVTRDLKNYISNQSPREIPVGYSAADVRDVLADSWSYLQCAIDGSKSDASKIDFFGLNSYSWCGGDATFETSGYDILISRFSNTTIPVFLSEYGCNKVEPRVFDEVQALYSPKMTRVMSGGLVYEYSQESNNYGLVNLFKNGSAELLVDYDNLQDQYNKLDIKAFQSKNSSAIGLLPPSCKSDLIDSSSFNNRFTLPKLPAGGQDIINNGLRKPNTGKLVAVNDTEVLLAVFGSQGRQLKSLAITPFPDDQSNTPGGSDTSGPDASGATTSTTPVAEATPIRMSTASRASIYIFIPAVLIATVSMLPM